MKKYQSYSVIKFINDKFKNVIFQLHTHLIPKNHTIETYFCKRIKIGEGFNS